jgi:transcriptional regulator with XRE-family HTH domain
MDWKEVIAELTRLGTTQPQIAEACGCSQGTVSLLANGKTKDPRDSLGQKLRALLEAKRAQAAENVRAAPPPLERADQARAAVGG